MRKDNIIRLKSKTGFAINNPNLPLTIRDLEGRIFYSNEGFGGRIKQFNLPANVSLFIDSGSITKLNKPIDFKLFFLPKRERYNKQSPYNFEVRVGRNPNKATINWLDETITVDHLIAKKNSVVNDWIRFHEYGHQYYRTEKYADLYAVNCMLKKGYNPTQIGLIILKTLSPNQIARKKFIIEKLVRHARS